MTAGLAQAYARGGEVDRARALEAELETIAARRHVPHSLIAQVHAALGNVDAAVAAIERAAKAREPELVLLGVRPVYASLHGQPRFAAVRASVGV